MDNTAAQGKQVFLLSHADRIQKLIFRFGEINTIMENKLREIHGSKRELVKERGVVAEDPGNGSATALLNGLVSQLNNEVMRYDENLIRLSEFV